jgi:hypothetical protein
MSAEAWAVFWPANVSVGSIATHSRRARNVRFAPQLRTFCCLVTNDVQGHLRKLDAPLHAVVSFVRQTTNSKRAQHNFGYYWQATFQQP